MEDNELGEILHILLAGLRLKRRRRTGWIDYSIRNPESVADHSYGLALMAMLLADLKGLDAEKAVKMALMHDLAEAYLGDLAPRQKKTIGRENVHKLEHSILATLIKQLPRKLSLEYLKLVEELYENKTPEAKLVHELDKLEMALESIMLEQETGKKLRKFRREALETEIGRELLNLVKDMNSRRS